MCKKLVISTNIPTYIPTTQYDNIKKWKGCNTGSTKSNIYTYYICDKYHSTTLYNNNNDNDDSTHTSTQT